MRFLRADVGVEIVVVVDDLESRSRIEENVAGSGYNSIGA